MLRLSLLSTWFRPAVVAMVALIVAVVGMQIWSTSLPLVRAEGQPFSYAPCGSSGVELIGFSEVLNKTKFGGFDVAELSGITYDRGRGTYYVVADRSGPVSTHNFRLDIPLLPNGLGTPSVVDAVVLKDSASNPFTGVNFDGEGIVVTPNHQFLVASEGGSGTGEQPEIRRFSSSGEYLGELTVPQRFLIGTNNLSFESLALNPQGHSVFMRPNRTSLFTAVEGPLSADGRTADLQSRIRILRYREQSKGEWASAEEYFYLTEPGRTNDDLGVAEIVALSEDRLLVLERGFVAGQGNTIRIFLVSLDGAKDVSGEASLSAAGLAPVEKTLLLDLSSCPPGNAKVPDGATQPNALLDNFEAMTLGPKLPGGMQSLILLSDDNGAANQTTRIIALAVPSSALGW